MIILQDEGYFTKKNRRFSLNNGWVIGLIIFNIKQELQKEKI